MSVTNSESLRSSWMARWNFPVFHRVILLTFVVLLTPAGLQAHDERALEILAASVASHSADYQRFEKATGTGTSELALDGGKRYNIDELEFAVNGDSIWENLNSTGMEPSDLFLHSKVQFVSDGTTIAAVRFSDRIKPAGCETDVRDMSYSDFGIVARSRIDLRNDLVPNCVRANYIETYNKHGAIVSDGGTHDGLEQVIVKYDESFWRFWLSPDWDHRLLRADLYVGNELDEGRLVSSFSYTYIQEDGGVRPQTITLEDRQYTNPERFDTYIVEIQSLTPGTDREFNIASLDLCDGARLIDRRKDAEIPVRNLSKSTIAQSPSASIAEQVVQLPNRHQKPAHDVRPDSRRDTATLLVLFNVVAVLIGAGVWFFMKRRSAS